jgi:L-seryl-tRNA(Ser) seleniumtransferase
MARSGMRLIPSIERLRQLPRTRALDATFGPNAVVAALRAEAAAMRAELGQTRDPGFAASQETGDDMAPAAERSSSRAPLSADEAATRILDGAEARLAGLFRSRLRSTINATGVILHTNLGRAPLAASALERVVEIGAGYTSLEYDLGRGARGRRDVHAEPLLCHLLDAEAALVVNNNAAAVLLLLTALAQGREVIVSRGELVEIGGGFRVPDVMRQSGAILREVGTTNRTRAADYAAAISDRTALILRVHPSNFVIEGFTARPALDELTAIGRQFDIPVAEDLGSGYLGARNLGLGAGGLGLGTVGSGLVATDPGLEGWHSGVRGQSDVADDASSEPGAPSPEPLKEPTVQNSLRAGADAVTFSGDKLLGGPQAGVIAGRRDLVDAMRRHPLMRALRVDKLTYAALEATLVEHARGRAAATVPVIQMLTMAVEDIDRRARALVIDLTGAAGLRASIVDGLSAIGGGSAPGTRLPTRLVAIDAAGLSADTLLMRLREHHPPIIARIEQDLVVLDLRTVLPHQDATVRTALLTASQWANVGGR